MTCRKARLHGGGRTPAKKKKKNVTNSYTPQIHARCSTIPLINAKGAARFFFWCVFFFSSSKSLNDKVDIIFSAAPPDDHVRTVLCTFFIRSWTGYSYISRRYAVFFLFFFPLSRLTLQLWSWRARLRSDECGARREPNDEVFSSSFFFFFFFYR